MDLNNQFHLFFYAHVHTTERFLTCTFANDSLVVNGSWCGTNWYKHGTNKIIPSIVHEIFVVFIENTFAVHTIP